MNTTPKTAPTIAISPEELARLAIRRYEGPIHLVEDREALERSRHVLQREHVVGMDTETRPSFRKGEAHPTSLVQVATAHEVFLFCLKRVDCSNVLTELLESERVIKAGIGLSHDFSKLRLNFPFQEANIVDLSAVAKNRGMGQPSVRNLTGLYLGFRITKGQSTSNWARAELTPNQILYAATDAWVCRELYLCFHKRGYLD